MSSLFKELVNLSGGKMKKVGTKPNQYRADPVVISLNEDEAKVFNKVYFMVRDAGLRKIIRTPRGAIAICRENNYSFDVSVNRCGARLTILLNGYEFVWRIGRDEFNAGHVKGWEAWRLFIKLCEEFNIDLKSMEIENGAEVKKTIEKPMIRMLCCHTELENVHHIDFHSSYASGLALTHPEFRPLIEKLYNERKRKPFYKDVLNCVIGYMQSISKCSARWAHLAKDAIANNNTRVLAVSMALLNSGRKIIGYNTDGIWYQGPIYHENRGGSGSEGDGVGKWHNDHINCKFRAKSDGAYEFIEDGKYHPVVRGLTKMDRMKERKYWEWGDIYSDHAEVIKFTFTEENGLVIVKNEEDDYDE